MSKIKRFFAILTALSMLMSICIFASAEEVASDVSIKFNSSEVKLAKEFNVIVSLTNNQTENAYGSEFEFYYDSSLLEFSSFSASAEDNCPWETEILNNKDGLLHVTSFTDFSSVSDISTCGLTTGKSIQIILTFKAIGAGDAVVSVKNAILLQSELFLDYDLSDVSETISISYPAKISGASLLLDTGIRIVFYALVPDEYAEAEMHFVQESTNENGVSMDNEKIVSGTATGATGKFNEKTLPKYEYIIGSNPDKMGEKIHASLIYDGIEIAGSQKYSVIDYCNKAFSRDRSYYTNYSDEQYEAFITLLCDLLSYGEASQKYTGHNKENPVTNLVTEGYELKPSEFVPLQSGDKAVMEGDISDPTISSAALALDSSFWLSYKVKATSIDNVRFSVHVDMGDSTNEYTMSSKYLVQTDEGVYYLPVRPAVKGVDYVYSITVYDGNGNKGRTVKYSVKSYVYSHQNSETLGPIVQRLYNYATSLRSFANMV